MVFPLYLCVAVSKMSDVNLGSEALVMWLVFCNAPLELEKGIVGGYGLSGYNCTLRELYVDFSAI